MAQLPNVASLDPISAAWANSLIAQGNAQETAIATNASNIAANTAALAVVTANIVPANNVANVAGSTWMVYRIGKLCIMHGMLTVTIPMTAEGIMTLGTVPAGLRPAWTVNSTCRYVSGGNSSAVVVPCLVQSDGIVLSIGPAQVANSQVHVNSTCWTLP